MKTAIEIADAINAAGRKHYNDSAKGWISPKGNVSRVYFGKEYVTIETSGEIHNRTAKARSKSIGDSAVDLVTEFAN